MHWFNLKCKKDIEHSSVFLENSAAIQTLIHVAPRGESLFM